MRITHRLAMPLLAAVLCAALAVLIWRHVRVPDQSSTTIALLVRQPTCGALSSAEWSHTLSVLDTRIRIYRAQDARVARVGACGLSVAVEDLADPAGLAAVLSGPGRLMLYGINDLTLPPPGAAFPAVARRCEVSGDRPPCVLITTGDIDQRHIGIERTLHGWPYMRMMARADSHGQLYASEYTRKHIGGRITVVFDDRVLADPIIGSALSFHEMVFTLDSFYPREEAAWKEAARIAIELQSGELPDGLIIAAIRH